MSKLGLMLRTLGQLRVEGCPLGRTKPLLLLAYLALEGPKPRRHLAELFWPGVEDPLNNLSVALNALRTHGLVEGQDILKARVPCDVEELRRALRQKDFPRVRALYQGAFLEGADAHLGEELEEWVWSTRERIAREVYRAYREAAEGLTALGLGGEAARLLEEGRGLPGVGQVLEGEEPAPQNPLPEEAEATFWTLYLLEQAGLPLDVLQDLGITLGLEALEALHARGLLGPGGRPTLRDLPLPPKAQALALTLARRLPLGQARALYRLGKPLWTEEDRARMGRALLQEAKNRLAQDPLGSLEVLEEAPASPEATALRVRALERLGRYREAWEVLEEAGEGLAEAPVLKGLLLFRMGRVEEALESVRSVEGLGPWAQGEALNLEGLVRMGQGAFREAADLFARAAVRFLAAGETARQVDALNNQAVALFEAGDPRAEEVFAEALKTAEDLPLLQGRLLLNLGLIRERLGRLEEAEALYRTALRRAEEVGNLEAMGRAWNNLGAFFHRQGRKEEAEAAYREALRLARESREWVLTAVAMANLAELKEDRAALEEAIALLEEAGQESLAARYRKRLQG